MTDLEEEFAESDQARLRRRLPWLLMLDTARVAADPKKLLLAAAAIALVRLAWAGIDRLPFAEAAAPERQAVAVAAAQLDRRPPLAPFVVTPTDRARARFQLAAGVPATGLEVPGTLAGLTERSLPRLLLPAALVNDPLAELTARGASWSRLADLMLRTLAALAVWALLGGAIARLAALRMTDDHPDSLIDAIKYSGRHLISSIGGPTIPLVGFFSLWGLVALAGLLARIPTVGPIVAGVLWIPILALGLFAAILLLGTLLSWPLMVATLSIEGTDAFDALSRAFGYLFGRPLMLAGLALLAVLVGSLGTLVVVGIAELASQLAMRFVATGYAGGVLETDAALRTGDDASAILAWSQSVWDLVAASYPAAFFWTATTAAYLLLRRSFEGTPLDRIWIPPSEQRDDLLPLVGEPAAEAREAELSKADVEIAESTDEKPLD